MGGKIIKSGREKFIGGQEIRKGVVMTRKRFIKQAMSFGVQRDEANLMADQILHFESYDKLFAAMKTRLALRKFVSSVARTLAQVVKTLGRVLT